MRRLNEEAEAALPMAKRSDMRLYGRERSAGFRQACLKTTKLAAKPYRKWDFLMSFSRKPARSFRNS